MIKKRLTLGFVMDTVVSWADTDYYQSLILSGISEFAEQKDINIMCFVAGKLHSYQDWESSRNILYEFIDIDKVDGLILLTSAIEAFDSSSYTINKLINCKNIPVVTIGDKYEGYHSVSVDNVTGMGQVVDHLIETHGCKRLAFIKGPEGSLESEVRYHAFCDSLKKHNLSVIDELIYNGNFLISSGVEAVKYLDANNLEFDAIVAANDIMAVGALEELNKELGNKFYDIPVTGFDNVDISKVNSLTTVNQPCHDLGYKAAQTLYSIINGEETKKDIQLPSEMVIRSSCTCIPGVVRNAEFEKDQIKKEFINKDFNQFKKATMNLLKIINNSSGITPKGFVIELLKYQEEILNAFFEEIENGKKDTFLRKWNELLFLCINKRVNLFFLHNIISTMRKCIIGYMDEEQYSVTIENMFQSTRIQISEAIRRAGSSGNVMSPEQMYNLVILEESLISNMDTQVQMKLIEKYIFNFEINRCYISLYEDPFKPLDFSKLILAVKKGKRFDTEEYGIRYSTLKMLPESFMKELHTERFSIVIQALHLGQSQIGFCIFGYKGKINRAFEILRNRLSIALNGALMIERIRDQSVELEKQVIERTKELSVTNNQLLDEINKRSEAERKLRLILDELAEYNSQLHYQSIRDELTGLYNRRGFMKIGYEQYQNFKNKNKGFLLFFGDLDGLKQINDRYGHSEGDIAIRSFAEILNKSFRDTDIIARLGGDEYTVIALGASPTDEAVIMERLNKNCENYNKSSNKPYAVSISIGSSYFDPQENVGFDVLMKLADEALYREKQKKKAKSANIII
ncbi:MAG: diguanylate cyclase [Bacillota bacterium]|nr:diguanylate cyclase [Bacillota bacterium]